MSRAERTTPRNDARYRIGPDGHRPVGAPPPDPTPRGAPGGPGRLIGAACWAYPALLAVVWAVQATLGDRWWPATLQLYGPRWIWGLPLAALLPLSLLLHRPAIRSLLFATILLLGPVMGFVVPWRAWVAGTPQGPSLRVLTCNTDRKGLDPEALGDLIDQLQPDVVVLQEWSDRNRERVFRDDGWHWAFVRLGLASRYPILSVERLDDPRMQGRGSLIRVELDAPGGPIRLVNLHFETPRRGIEAVLEGGLDGVPDFQQNIHFRWHFSAAARELIDARGGADVVAGDFNLTADSPIFRRYWSADRDAFGAVGWGFGYTKYTPFFGARIDHVLAGPSWRPARATVGPDVGSDHRPLIVDLVRVGPGAAVTGPP